MRGACAVALGTALAALNKRPRGVTVSTLDSESSDRGSNPREASSVGFSTQTPKHACVCTRILRARRHSEPTGNARHRCQGALEAMRYREPRPCSNTRVRWARRNRRPSPATTAGQSAVWTKAGRAARARSFCKPNTAGLPSHRPPHAGSSPSAPRNVLPRGPPHHPPTFSPNMPPAIPPSTSPNLAAHLAKPSWTKSNRHTPRPAQAAQCLTAPFNAPPSAEPSACQGPRASPQPNYTQHAHRNMEGESAGGREQGEGTEARE